jgi:hypothetical protein
LLQADEFRHERRAMSIIYSCNLCGETIADGEPFVTLNGNGDRSGNVWKTGWVGHYHSRSSDDCWRRILDAIRVADGSARRLDHIPIATSEEIASRRDLHQQQRLTDRTANATKDDLLSLSLRTRNLLGAAGIDGLSGLRARLADGSVSDVPGIGRRRLEEIRAALESGPDVVL